MSPREQPVAARDPLAMTVARTVETAMRTRGRWLILAGLLGTGGLTAKETGALDMLIPKGGDPRVSAIEKRIANTDRLVRWLVRQEIRRQAREGTPVVEPPEDIE